MPCACEEEHSHHHHDDPAYNTWPSAVVADIRTIADRMRLPLDPQLDELAEILGRRSNVDVRPSDRIVMRTATVGRETSQLVAPSPDLLRVTWIVMTREGAALLSSDPTSTDGFVIGPRVSWTLHSRSGLWARIYPYPGIDPEIEQIEISIIAEYRD
jgi:hypothetical protein